MLSNLNPGLPDCLATACPNWEPQQVIKANFFVTRYYYLNYEGRDPWSSGHGRRPIF